MEFKKSHLKYLLHAAVLIGLIVAGVKYLNGEQIFQALKTFDYGYAPFVLLLALGYLFLKAWRFVLLQKPLAKDPPASAIIKAYVAGQAAVMVPGGITARAGLLKQIGVPFSQGGILVTFNSGLDQIVMIGTALVASFWFEKGRTPLFIMLGVSVAIILLLVIPQSRRQAKSLADRLAAKFGVEKQWADYLDAFPKVLTVPTLSLTLGLTIAAFACHIIAFDLTLRGFDVSLPYSILMLAYILPTILGRFSGLPGGFGVTEAGMVGFLTATTADLTSNTAFAAAAIFRIGTIVFPALVGALVYFLIWRRVEKETEDVASASSS